MAKTLFKHRDTWLNYLGTFKDRSCCDESPEKYAGQKQYAKFSCIN